MPSPTEKTVSKAKTALVYLSITVAILLLLLAIKHSSVIKASLGIQSVWLVAAIIIAVLVLNNRQNPDRTPHAPLFSFPSLSPPLRYEPLVENNVDFPEPEVVVRSAVPQDLEPDTVHDSERTDEVDREKGEPSKTTVFQEPESFNLPDDQGSDETLDDTWNSIIARGNAKPIIRLSSYPASTSKRQDDNQMPEMRRSATEKRKEKKKSTEGSSYDSDSLERKAEGWRKRDAIAITNDELSHLSDMFIKKQYNNLIIERQESDQRRLAERLRFNDYRNAVSAVN